VQPAVAGLTEVDRDQRDRQQHEHGCHNPAPDGAGLA
jgi:hypothetical protein